MLFAIGWCVLRSSRAPYANATSEDIDAIDDRIDAKDARLWAEFRAWMAENNSPFVLWTLHEHHNNHRGVLQCFVSRNHRSSPFWPMLDWIAEHGPDSYGLFHVLDDEDFGNETDPRDKRGNRDYSNVFRVHRIFDGRAEELPDPFFGEVVPNIEPPYPEA